LSIRGHPLDFVRASLKEQGVLMAKDLLEHPTDRKVSVAGIVVARQMPATASGVLFLSLEDESGMANVVVWPSLMERYRGELLKCPVLLIRGKLERSGLVANVIAERIEPLSISEQNFKPTSRSFC
jgi:error-prone DNA polymerase